MINKDVLNNIYNDLLELSDRDVQNVDWLTGANGKASSYIELMCRLFDDNDFDSFVEREIYELKTSDEFIKKVQDLRNSLNAYDGDDKSSIEIIDDPNWHKIIDKAKAVVSIWKTEIGD